MGKLLLYESGAVKMKLGDLLFDIAPGTQIMAAQQLAAVGLLDPL
jgi:DNA-directed RNA polymerase III subunit RPC4